MAANRKLQTEIQQVLKKVEEGIEVFDDILGKVYAAEQQSLKEKFEGELKKEIKKLQRFRDQIKTWIGSNDIKDKSQLLEMRRTIETKMEVFKVCEKDTKTKAYSKEGLAREAKLDPKEALKEEKRAWLNDSLDKLHDLIDSVEADKEKLLGAKGSKNKNKEALEKYENRVQKHKWHIAKIELIIKLIENDELDPSQVECIQEGVDYYIESAPNDDGSTGVDKEYDIYEDLDLETLAGGITPAFDLTARSTVPKEDDIPPPIVKVIPVEAPPPIIVHVEEHPAPPVVEHVAPPVEPTKKSSGGSKSNKSEPVPNKSNSRNSNKTTANSPASSKNNPQTAKGAKGNNNNNNNNNVSNNSNNNNSSHSHANNNAVRDEKEHNASEPALPKAVVVHAKAIEVVKVVEAKVLSISEGVAIVTTPAVTSAASSVGVSATTNNTKASTVTPTAVAAAATSVIAASENAATTVHTVGVEANSAVPLPIVEGGPIGVIESVESTIASATDENNFKQPMQKSAENSYITSSSAIGDEHETDDMPHFDPQSMNNFDNAMADFGGFNDMNMNMFHNGMADSSMLQLQSPQSEESRITPEMMVSFFCIKLKFNSFYFLNPGRLTT